MTTSKQVFRFLKRAVSQGYDPRNSLDAAMALRAQDNARRNASRARAAEADWRKDYTITRRQAA